MNLLNEILCVEVIKNELSLFRNHFIFISASKHFTLFFIHRSTDKNAKYKESYESFFFFLLCLPLQFLFPTVLDKFDSWYKWCYLGVVSHQISLTDILP